MPSLGKCVDACPMNLHPMYLSQATQNSDYSKLEKLHAIDCIECGACTYICPAKRHPTENIRIAKQKLIAESKGVEK